MRRAQRVWLGLVGASLLSATAVVAATPAGRAASSGSVTVSPGTTLAGPSEAAMYPSGLIWDANRKVIVVADTGYDRITTFDPTQCGQTPPCSPAVTFGTYGTANGQLSTPRDVAVDSLSNIYVADAANSRIEKFDENGNWIWTAGLPGKTISNLNVPIGVSFAATPPWDPTHSEVIVADTGHSMIKAYDSASGSFLWSSANAGLASPREARLGPDGRLWVADYGHEEVKSFDVAVSGNSAPFTLRVTLGDGLKNGHASNELNSPYNVSFSPDGQTVYVADTGNERISRWNIATSPPTLLLPAFGSSCPTNCPAPPGNAQYFMQLRRVTVDPSTGNVWGADFWGSGLHAFHADGSVAQEIDGGTAPSPGFAGAFGVTVAADGTVYGVDRLNQRIEHLSLSGANLNTVGWRGVAPGRFSWPETAGVAPDGSVWVGDTRNGRLQHFPAGLATKPLGVFGKNGSLVGQFNYLEGVSVDASGVVWTADTNNNRIQTFNPSTSSFQTFPAIGVGTGAGQLRKPQDVVASASDFYVADTGNNRIEEFTLSGGYVGQFDSSTFSGSLNGPQGIALAPDGSIWVADTMNNRILHLSSNLIDLGDTFGSLGSGSSQLFQPHSLAVSPNGSTLYVADTYNNRIQAFGLSAP